MTRLEELQEITKEGYRTLQRLFTGLFILGGSLIAASQAIMFGVVPECQPPSGHERTG